MFLDIIRDVTDPLSMSEWNVLWMDDNGKSHCKRFYWKHQARDFYNDLPYMNKRMERV